MNRPYLDTGLVLKLVVLEPLSAAIQAWLQKHRVPVSKNLREVVIGTLIKR